MSEDVGNGDDGDDGEVAKHFWTTLPGILTGIAALITAGVGAAVLFMGDDDGSDSVSTTTGGGSSQSSAAAGSPEPSQSSAPSPAPAGGPAQEEGSVVLRAGDFLDVDTGESGSAVSGELNWSGSQFNLYAPRAAIVDGPLDLAGCESILATRSDAVLYGPRLTDGPSYVCVTTESRAIALLSVTPPDVRTDLSVARTLWP